MCAFAEGWSASFSANSERSPAGRGDRRWLLFSARPACSPCWARPPSLIPVLWTQVGRRRTRKRPPPPSPLCLETPLRSRRKSGPGRRGRPLRRHPRGVCLRWTRYEPGTTQTCSRRRSWWRSGVKRPRRNSSERPPLPARPQPAMRPWAARPRRPASSRLRAGPVEWHSGLRRCPGWRGCTQSPRSPVTRPRRGWSLCCAGGWLPQGCPVCKTCLSSRTALGSTGMPLCRGSGRRALGRWWPGCRRTKPRSGHSPPTRWSGSPNWTLTSSSLQTRGWCCRGSCSRNPAPARTYWAGSKRARHTARQTSGCNRFNPARTRSAHTEERRRGFSFGACWPRGPALTPYPATGPMTMLRSWSTRQAIGAHPAARHGGAPRGAPWRGPSLAPRFVLPGRSCRLCWPPSRVSASSSAVSRLSALARAKMGRERAEEPRGDAARVPGRCCASLLPALARAKVKVSWRASGSLGARQGRGSRAAPDPVAPRSNAPGRTGGTAREGLARAKPAPRQLRRRRGLPR